eukprot:3624924-Amphidinium_carterae.1
MDATPGVATQGAAEAPKHATPGVEMPDTWLRPGGSEPIVDTRPIVDPAHGSASANGSCKGFTIA